MGGLPRAASRNLRGRSRKDPPLCSATAPLHRLRLLHHHLLLPSFPSSFTGSPRPPSPSDRLAAARPLGYPPVAAHSLQHREPGPAPEEGAAGKLQPGPNPLLRDLRELGKRAETLCAPRCGTGRRKRRVSNPHCPGQPARRLQRWAQPPRLARSGPLVGSAWRWMHRGNTRAERREDPTSALQPRPQMESGL